MSPLQIIGLFALAIAAGCVLAAVFLARTARRYPTPRPVKHFERNVP